MCRSHNLLVNSFTFQFWEETLFACIDVSQILVGDLIISFMIFLVHFSLNFPACHSCLSCLSDTSYFAEKPHSRRLYSLVVFELSLEKNSTSSWLGMLWMLTCCCTIPSLVLLYLPFLNIFLQCPRPTYIVVPNVCHYLATLASSS